ncbi:MAG: hypothetical protein HXK61_02750 [Atopobiaceae bacterium]|nr:hypothetical protein [Atopobiaceae bacterium]
MDKKSAATVTSTGAVSKDTAPKNDVGLKKALKSKSADLKKKQEVDLEFARAENEDDDGYDPYSDRRPVSEPLFEKDPWS